MEKLPKTIYQSLEDLSSKYSFQLLKEKSSQLFSSYLYYENKKKTQIINDDALALVYGLTRFPSTYSVCYEIIKKLFDNLSIKIDSINDFGFGLGAASLAAYNYFKNESIKINGYEVSLPMIKLSKQILPFEINFFNTDFNFNNTFQKSDLSIISYVASELDFETIKTLINNVLESTNKIIIIVEPGTKSGFQKINNIKSIVSNTSWNIISPCSSFSCPLNKEDRFCHFSLRVERYKKEKLLKSGDFGFQDEKYIYLCLAKNNIDFQKRFTIVQKPKAFPFGIEFTVCDNDKEKTILISKNKHKNYKHFKKMTLGDTINVDDIF